MTPVVPFMNDLKAYACLVFIVSDLSRSCSVVQTAVWWVVEAAATTLPLFQIRSVASLCDLRVAVDNEVWSLARRKTFIL